VPLGHLLKIKKIETIDNFYVKQSYFLMFQYVEYTNFKTKFSF